VDLRLALTAVAGGRLTAKRGWLLAIAALATVLFDGALTLIDRGLQATGGPSILGLEFAGSLQRVEEITAEWGAHGVFLARLSLWIDFGFMVSYGAFLTLAAVLVRDYARGRDRHLLARAGALAPYLAAAAPLLDATENVIWLLLLGDHGGDAAAGFATACAALKFLLVGLAIAYALWGLASWLWGRRGSTTRRGHA
jgi:hypothetical protein